jgi:hypothetical protein
MGTLLTAVVVGHGRLAHQSRAAQERLEACTVANALLDRWWTAGQIPRDTQGDVEGREGWTWRTSTEPMDAKEGPEAEVVVLKVFAPGADPESASTQVRVLVARETYETGEGPDAD